MKPHRVGQVWVRNEELRVCLDPKEGRYVSLMNGGEIWVWTLEERSVSEGRRQYLDFWWDWEEIS